MAQDPKSVEALEAEIKRLQDAKNRALAIADERCKENVRLRQRSSGSRAFRCRSSIGRPMSDQTSPTDEDRKTMREIMDGIRSHAHFRYPVDGNWSDLDKIFQTALDEMFGPDSPNSAHNRWVRRLRRHGLIR
jgi:hypothetical protein